MARLLTAGAEEGGRRAMADLFSLQGTSPNAVDINGPQAIAPRTGDYCYYVYGAASSGDYFQYALPGGLTEIYFGFAIYVPANSTSAPTGTSPSGVWFPAPDTFVRINLGTGQIQSGYNALGSVIILASAAITPNAWHYVEVHIVLSTSTGGTCTVKVDGVQVLNSTSARTAQNVANFDTMRFYGYDASSSATWMLYDDIVVNDTSGSVNNAWPGQVRLYPLRARAAGDSQQWARKGVDLGYNQGQVREAGSGLAWIEDNTSGHLDLAALDSPVFPAGATVTNVIVETHARTQAGGSQIKNELKSGSAAGSDSAAITLATAWTAYQSVWATDPATGSAWALSSSQLPALQAGPKVV